MRKASAGGSESPPHDPESSLSEDPGQSSSDDTYEAPPSRASYNLTKTPRFAMELVRSGTSTRAGASLGNVLSPDVNIELLMMDKNKISRQMDAAKIKSILSTQADSLVCVGIDGRNDTHILLYREVEDSDGNRQLHIPKVWSVV